MISKSRSLCNILKTNKYQIAYIPPGTGYIGMQYFVDNNRIRVYSGKNESGIDTMMGDVMNRHPTDPKYVLIRSTTKKEALKVVDYLSDKLTTVKVGIFDYCAKNKPNSIITSMDDLQVAPLVHTVVIIVGIKSILRR